jgi:hypothetical protein
MVMRKYYNNLVRLVIGLTLLLTLSGCAVAVGVLGTVGSGMATGADFITSNQVTKTVSYDYDRVKKALLVTLCKMVIDVEKVQETKEGEKIYAQSDDLKVVIVLKEVTPKMTSMKISAGEGLVKRDKATAQEIVQRTTQTVKRLIT